jgi:hypothetical protein
MTADDEIREAARLARFLATGEIEPRKIRVAAGPVEPNLTGQRHKPVRRLP